MTATLPHLVGSVSTHRQEAPTEPVGANPPVTRPNRVVIDLCVRLGTGSEPKPGGFGVGTRTQPSAANQIVRLCRVTRST